jgi:hypothetical protein
MSDHYLEVISLIDEGEFEMAIFSGPRGAARPRPKKRPKLSSGLIWLNAADCSIR